MPLRFESFCGILVSLDRFNPQTPAVVASIELGEAIFSPQDATARIDVQYRVPALVIESSGMGERETVAAACEKEIAYMRAALHGLAGELLKKVSPSIGTANLERRHPTWDEKRHWSRSAETFLIHPQQASIRSVVRFNQGIPNGAVIRGAFINLLADREDAIRSVYQQIEKDLLQRG